MAISPRNGLTDDPNAQPFLTAERFSHGFHFAAVGND